MAPQSSHRKSLSSRIFGRRGAVKERQLLRTQLRFETLESRALLAADMAEIIGVVTADLQGDGDSSNDVVVSGASAALYRDNGNGSFDSGDALVQSGAATDSAGQYRFTGVGVGRYFVQITPPSEMHFAPGEDVRSFDVSAAEADFVVGQTIDDFESNQRVTASPPLPSSDPARLNDSSVLGGERDLYVELTDGDDPFSSVSIVTGAGLMRLASDTTVTGDAKIVWDGVDDSASGVNPTGLYSSGGRGIDLTAHNGNKMTGIALTVGADHPNSQVSLRVYTDANNWTEFAATVPESPGGAATKYLVFAFEDASADSSGNGADFSNVGAIELTFEGVSAVDGQVALVGLVGHAVKRVDFVTQPKLSVGDHVFNDVNNNGVLDPGEQGIGGVKLNLIADVNGNDAYDSGVDELLSLTETDASGRYKFADLFPGKYMVQVAPENFDAGRSLDGRVTSTGNDPASDPDDNVDGDDNGTAIGGFGVISKSVMLAGGEEPTNDGDNDADTNLTVDFGFYGFDLVLDKSVDVGDGNTTSPEDPLTYTIVVNNDGPSAAFDVQFEDALPGHVAYRSGTASNGAALQHSNGRVTSNLGDVAPGASVTLTILVDVASNAAGTLTNEASVIAPGEINLSNNTDRVSNPVNPEIDLTIEKSDSDDPVDPGQTFSYTLTATNNGPSEATGVEVVDTLPDGLSFVSASRTPANHSGDRVTFSLGNLAAGQSADITITVKVDETFSGTLLNHAEVFANEAETDYTNNEDTEPTEVRPKIDLEIIKTDSDDPVRPGDTFRYTIQIRNNGPSNATGVTIVDTLPATGVEFQGASQAPANVDGDKVSFDVGNLASGDTHELEIRVAVDQSFIGTLLNTAEVSANEDETHYDNNVDDEPTQVTVEPSTLGGNVYVDSNNNGVLESNEQPIAGVVITLTGSDFRGNSVTRTTETDSGGRYMFIDLAPGTYNLTETHPTSYKDGKDAIGDNGDGVTTQADGLVALDLNDLDDFDADALAGIQIAGGVDGTNYNFGELSGVGPGKADLLIPFAW